MLRIAVQAMHDLDDSSVQAYEVLARWSQGDTCTTPAKFMSGASENDWIDLDLLVAAAVARSAIARDDSKPLFVNVSGPTLQSSVAFARFTRELATLIRARKGRVVIEVPEQTTISDIELAARLVQFRRIGAQVALDDFGAGAANLDRFLMHQWDYCKIERDAILDVQLREEAELAMDLCVHNNTQVVIERIEFESMPLEMMKSRRGIWVQGFDWSRPVLQAEDSTAEVA